MISDVPAFGPLSQYFCILYINVSLNKTKASSGPTATPFAKYNLSSSVVVSLVFGSYTNNLPFGVCSIASIWSSPYPNLSEASEK